MPDRPGPSTRAVHAGRPAPEQGAPFLPPLTLAAPYHLIGPADASEYGYGRYSNPTWTALEAALGELDGGPALAFASGMAAIAALLGAIVQPRETLVIPADGYPGIPSLDRRGVRIRAVATDTATIAEACEGARLVVV